MGNGEPRDFITSLNRGFAAIAGWSFDHRWWVVLAGAALLGGTVYLALQAQVDSSYEAYFAPDDPVYLAYEQFREDFGSDEISYVLYAAPGIEHGPWNLEVMRKLAGLTQVLEDEVPFIYEVNTLVNAELTEGVPDGIDISEIGDAFPETQEELLALRERYLAKPMLVGGLLSADAEYGAIIIEMDRSSTDPLEDIRLDPEGGDALANLYPQVTDAAIDEILARPEYAGIDFYHSGDVPLNAYYNRIIDTETGTLMLYTAGVIAVLLSLFFRSLVGILGPLVAQLSVLACVAFIVLVGWKLGLGFTIVPTMLTAIGVAHSVHILSEFRARFAEVGDRREGLVQTLYLVGAPCLLTSLTTAAGFAAMSFVPIKSLAQMGVYGAVGVLAALTYVVDFAAGAQGQSLRALDSYATAADQGRRVVFDAVEVGRVKVLDEPLLQLLAILAGRTGQDLQLLLITPHPSRVLGRASPPPSAAIGERLLDLAGLLDLLQGHLVRPLIAEVVLVGQRLLDPPGNPKTKEECAKCQTATARTLNVFCLTWTES